MALYAFDGTWNSAKDNEDTKGNNTNVYRFFQAYHKHSNTDDFYLAGVGTRSGYAFFNTFSQSGGLAIFVAGTIITCVTALTVLCLGHYLLRIPMGLLSGILAGLQTQPAVLGFALEQSENDLPNIGYATVYPIATILKILLAQLLLALLR